MTEYLILHKLDSGAWTEFKKVGAASSKAAIREALNGASKDGEFVAVPSRSWQPVKVVVEQALKFS